MLVLLPIIAVDANAGRGEADCVVSGLVTFGFSSRVWNDMTR